MIVIAFFLCKPCLGYAQDDLPPEFQFSHKDSLALNVKYDGNVVALTKQLTDPYKDELSKARAIFIWITGNIAYDYKHINREGNKDEDPVVFDCPSDDSLTCIIKEKVWENDYINKALDKKKAICQGYAMLFKRMCDIAGLHAEVVPGYTRTQYYQVGTFGDLDHAWNAVQLDGTYYLLDATWAAGYCPRDDDDEDKLKPFVRHFNQYYWLTPPEEFAKDHFPLDPKWTLLHNFTKEKFAANPYYDLANIGNIEVLAPSSGIIKARKGDTIRFKIKFPYRIKSLQINTNSYQNPEIWYKVHVKRGLYMNQFDSLAFKKQLYVAYKLNGDTYEFSYIVKDYTLEYMDILFDYRRMLRFKVTNRR